MRYPLAQPETAVSDSLTSRERIALALDGRPVDRVPFCPNLAYVWEHWPESVRADGMLALLQRVGADPLWRGAPCPVRTLPPAELETRSYNAYGRGITEYHTPVGDLRLAYAYSEAGRTTFLVEHPLKTEADLKVQMWIEEHTRFEVNLEPVERHRAGDGSVGLSVGMLLPRCKTAFQLLIEHFVGTEELAYLLADHQDGVEALLALMVERDCEAVRLAASTGAYDWWLTWEDSSTQNYSPSQYNAYISPEIRLWCRLLGEQRYMQHACGHVKALVGQMVADGVAAIESVSPPPTGNLSLAGVRAAVGREFGIVGGIEPTHFLSLSLEELGPYTEQVLADGAGGPFVLANSDSCPPGVTVEKFAKVAEIARATGA